TGASASFSQTGNSPSSTQRCAPKLLSQSARMTSRTNLRQQLLKQQPQPATSAVQNLIVTRAPAASSLQNGGQAAWQQPQSRGGVLTIVKQSPQEETSPLSPNSTTSVSDPQNAMEEVDIDFIDPTFGQLSSTVPTHSGHLAGFGAPSADDGASTGSFGLGGGGGAGASGSSGGFKPSTSAPASTQLFLAMNQQLGGAGGGAAAAGVVGFSIGGGQAADDDKTVSLRDRYKKESHNRIERKRRENINYQISELGECIPKAWFRERTWSGSCARLACSTGPTASMRASSGSCWASWLTAARPPPVRPSPPAPLRQLSLSRPRISAECRRPLPSRRCRTAAAGPAMTLMGTPPALQ
ncbi:hypothetical protein BOX15_Mlig031573g1, partial [Macrostomum lignano]